ncbi:HNH endonuclease signature motif containing protein [Streptosporangium sp. NPDC000563]|uniref:HNH endonuclease n=1 Tax=Streptosporangium sp. NPDC000563 TaxID=3154366 RepID=UPI00331DB4F4
MSRINSEHKKWITHQYFRTYDIADRLTDIARHPLDYLLQLEDLTLDYGVSVFAPSWQKKTMLHRFAERVADEMFATDTEGPYVTKYVIHEPPRFEEKRFLPVDLAMQLYGILDDPFEVPVPDGEIVPAPEVGPNVSKWKDSGKVANACYEYFQYLKLTQPYEDLLSCIGDEVFHVVFQNREVLAGLNDYIAKYVEEVDPAMLDDQPDIACLFASEGKLKRVAIPKWVKRAVFFREYGRCAQCGMDLTNLLDALPQEQFDHIIPLARGGLNDITNIQMLCQKCNNAKSDKAIAPSRRYRRFFS